MFKQLLMGAATLLGGALCSEAASYTVYYYDKAPTGDYVPDMRPVKVHVWHTAASGDVAFKAWDNNEDAIFMKQTVEIDGVKYPVYSYTFEWDNEPNGIIFHKNRVVAGSNTIVTNVQSPNLKFTNGAFYSMGDAKDSAGLTLNAPKFEEMEPNYSIYFADVNNWGVANTKVHVWNPAAPLNAWEQNEAMSATGKYVEVDGKYVPMYEYKFLFLGEPTNVIFHNSTLKTGDNNFTNGGVYRFIQNGVVTTPIENPTIVDESGLPPTCIYFADTDGWGADNTLVHVWGDNGDLTDWANNAPMTDTGKYARVNDVWAKVYKYEYRYTGEVTGLLFHRKSAGPGDNADNDITADLTETDGALYYYNGKKQKCTPVLAPELKDAIPADKIPGRLYVNLGANQIMQNLWHEPCAHVFRRTSAATDYEAELPEYGSDQYKKEVMTMVRDGFYMIEVDDISQCNDVIFYYARWDSNGEPTYQGQAFPASRSPHNDPSTWATFIYDIGIDCVHQSYLTEQEYNAGWNELPEALYMTGNSLVTGKDSNDPSVEKRLVANDGMYFFKFDIAQGDVAKFKLSRFSASKAALRHGFTMPKSETDKDFTYDVQRGWATFNLGILGFESDNEEGWYDKYIYSPGDGQSREVRLWVNNSVNFNNYTQYQWRLGDGEGGVAGGTYWLVVDLHEKDHSLQLLNFDPTPGISSVVAGVPTSHSISYEQAALLHDGTEFAGTQANGKLLFDKVNVLSGTGKFIGPSAQTLADGKYSVVYTIYCQDVPVAEFTDVAQEVAIPYLMAGENVPFKIRGYYTDTETGRHFCSQWDSKKITLANEFGTLWGLSNSEETQLHFRTKEDQDNGIVTACVPLYREFGFSTDPHYVYFPDYEMGEVIIDNATVEGIDHQLIHSDHFMAKRSTYAKWLGMKSDENWVPLSDETLELQSNNHWSNYIANEHNVPLFITGLKTGKVGEHIPVKGSAYFKFHALFPFLIKDLSKVPAPAAGPRKVATETTGQVPADLTGFRILTHKTSVDNEAKFDKTLVTGIDGVTVDVSGQDGEAEYYTIGGIRLKSAPTMPGVYVKRQNGKTEKIAIR